MPHIALVTGGSRGIGAAIAEVLKGKGIRVITPSRNELNLLSRDSIGSYIANVNLSVDILINNAGINPLAGITEINDADLEDTLRVNYIAPLQLIKGFIPSMITGNFGRIVNISSIWGNITKARRVAYSSSKAAINALTRSIAVEVAKHNVLINAVAPGFVNTELTRQNNTVEEIIKIENSIPIGRLAEPYEIAELVAFLCSEKNTYITGQVITIDGGYVCL